MPRHRRSSNASTISNAREHGAPGGQEMASMYDYLAKIILLGPSGSGKTCLLHRFIQSQWRSLVSQTVGVEFASKIVKVGTPGRRKRIKLQLWDTAGTERFRSVSRSYYRGAAGAILVYDVANQASFAGLKTFLDDVKALASPQCTVVLVGNKLDLADFRSQHDLLDDEPATASLGSQQQATISRAGRAVSQASAVSWANQHGIPTTIEVSALSGDGVDEVFHKLARTILTKIELGEINPDDPMSGIQYGDADYHRYDDGSSIKSGTTIDGYGSTRRRRPQQGGWNDVFRLGKPSKRGMCC